MKKSMRDRVVGIVAKVGIVRPRDLAARGIPREYVQGLTRQGELVRIGRGLYTLPDAPASTHRSFAEVSKTIPKAVICLVSALRFHDLTIQLPSEVWIALDQKARRPARAPCPIRIVHFSGRSLREGVEEHVIDGVPVRIYSAAKTVADCFKFRSKIGTDITVEALRDYLTKHRAGGDALWRFAKICRVANVMKPYLEAAG